jgi:hypothetical protein
MRALESFYFFHKNIDPQVTRWIEPLDKNRKTCLSVSAELGNREDPDVKIEWEDLRFVGKPEDIVMYTKERNALEPVYRKSVEVTKEKFIKEMSGN